MSGLASRFAALVALAALVLGAPSPARAQTADSARRYWIVVDAFVPGPAPSERAVARRALRGTSAPPADRTVAPHVREALTALGVTPVVESRWLGALSAPLTADQRQAVAALPFVREVRPVARVAEASVASQEPLVPLAPLLPRPPDAGPSLPQLQSIGADALLDAGYIGTGVRVGYLDTLFDFAHPALSQIGANGRLIAVQDFTGLPQANYHGLATTSVGLGYAPGQLIGPGWGAEVLGATTEYAPTETHAEEDYFIAGIEWLESQGVDVVSISLGYSTFDPGEGDYTYADLDGDTTPFTRAADRAATLGVVVVTSAGNEGASPWHFITAPADGDSVIAVGAVTPSGQRAGFSGWGPTADGRTKPDVAAQGTQIVYAVPGGFGSGGSGTSFSAPLVSGVVAQLLQARPSLTPMQVREALRSTASQASAPDNSLGWGVVNATAALAFVTTVPPEPGGPAWRLYPTVTRSGAPLTVETPEPVALDVVDAFGRVVARFGAAPLGRRTVAVPDLPGGVYFIQPDAALPALRIVVVR